MQYSCKAIEKHAIIQYYGNQSPDRTKKICKTLPCISIKILRTSKILHCDPKFQKWILFQIYVLNGQPKYPCKDFMHLLHRRI